MNNFMLKSVDKINDMDKVLERHKLKKPHSRKTR